jgi:hypothetical protein
VKKVFLKFLRKNAILDRVLNITKKSFLIFRNIKKASLRYSIIFLPKIIYGVAFFEKSRNMHLSKKDFFDKKFQWNYEDVFSSNIPVWENIVSQFNSINYLEIGSFEGRSTVFISEQKNMKSVMAVDTFKGSDEYDKDGMAKHNHISFDVVYENFKMNLKLVNKKDINFLKDTSDNFFTNNKSQFNLIYIDGSHHYDNVKKDFINAYSCIEKNGIMIFDDFLWFYYEDFKKNPICAIIECYKMYKDNLELIFLNHQIIFRKLN